MSAPLAAVPAVPPGLAFALAAGLALALPVRTGAQTPPTEQELASATIVGVREEPVTLRDGAWEGAPLVEGSVVRPRLALAPFFRLRGDLDGDGALEAAVLLSESTGGTGTTEHLAVLARRAGGVRSIGTAPLGDRVQLRDARLEDGRIVLDVLQAGPGDAMCCPSELARRVFVLDAEGLREASSERTGRFSLETLYDVTWVLTHLSRDEAAPEVPPVTMQFESGKVLGSSGCNRYFANVRAGLTAGEVEVGPAAGTRRACPPDVMSLETRFLAALTAAVKVGFVGGRLALTTRDDAGTTTLYFRGETLPEPDETAPVGGGDVGA